MVSLPTKGDIWQYLETFLIVTAGKGRLILVSSVERPGMLLNTLQYTRQLSTTKSYPNQNVNKVEKPWSGVMLIHQLPLIPFVPGHAIKSFFCISFFFPSFLCSPSPHPPFSPPLWSIFANSLVVHNLKWDSSAFAEVIKSFMNVGHFHPGISWNPKMINSGPTTVTPDPDISIIISH